MKRRMVMLLMALLLSCGLLVVTLQVRSSDATDQLSEIEIAELRKEYPISEENPSTMNTSLPEGWGANFATVFSVCDAVVSGTMISDVISSEESITPVDLGDWEGTIEELEALNPGLIEKNYIRYYWTFQVDEVLWEGEKSEVEKGDVLLFSVSDYSWCFDNLLEKDQEYVWSIKFNEVTGHYELFRFASYFKTDEDYLFSFVSGNNVNQYTGRKQEFYQNELNRAIKDSSVAGIAWDFSE